jgi:peptidoglycan/xylan/chitin deacetylase (PgdA/CDA1 family)
VTPQPIGEPGSTRHAAPLLASVGIARRHLTPRLWSPRLSGISSSGHVALTYDDGPDASSTPCFLSLLAEYDTRATFFVLGRHLGDGSLLRDISGQGHEIGIHGWDHTATVVRRRGRLADDLRRARSQVEELAGCEVHWYRPPYGLLTRGTLSAADAAGLEVVLWSAWGRDWTRRATPHSITRVVTGQVRPGGTVLLHDSDRTSAPDSWRSTLGATRLLLDIWRAQRLRVGPLSEHWSQPCDGVAG